MPGEVRDLVVTGCELLTSGNTNGKPWSLFKIRANRADTNEPVVVPLRSFAELAVGERAEFKVEARRDDQHGDSFLLTPKRPSMRVLQQRVQTLEEQVEELVPLKARVEDLEAQVIELTNMIERARSAARTAPTGD